MLNTVSKPAWAGTTLRLDPKRFPQQVTFELRAERTNATITHDERGAVLRKVLPSSGLPLSIALPPRAFKGVAARAIDHGNGQVTVTLELHHDDPGSGRQPAVWSSTRCVHRRGVRSAGADSHGRRRHPLSR